MYGWVIVKIIEPTYKYLISIKICQKLSLSGGCLTFRFIGVSTCLHSNKPVPFKMSNVYFLCEITEMTIPTLDYANSIARKYLSFFSSFKPISNGRDVV